jgi:hypothetical protein
MIPGQVAGSIEKEFVFGYSSASSEGIAAIAAAIFIVWRAHYRRPG